MIGVPKLIENTEGECIEEILKVFWLGIEARHQWH